MDEHIGFNRLPESSSDIGLWEFGCPSITYSDCTQDDLEAVPVQTSPRG